MPSPLRAARSVESQSPRGDADNRTRGGEGAEQKKEETLEDHLVDYRKYLVEAERKSQEQYDRAVLSLSGGALAISFAFLKDYLADRQPLLVGFLLAAWVCWGLSATAILASFFTSGMALRVGISQVDGDKIFTRPVGGPASKVTAFLNAAAGVLFLLGVVAVAVFASSNLR